MESKRKAKGFTLVELIIVVGIFSVILALVMSFIDPVSNIMKKASTREKTAAYVDNIAEYVDNSLHYAKFMRIYNGGYGTDITGATTEKKDEAAVKALLDEVLNGAVDANGNPLKGKARVLKFINTGFSEDDGVGGTHSYATGQIYESVYDFECGDHYTYGVDTYDICETIATISEAFHPIINGEHLVNYNFFYQLGYYSYNQIDTGINVLDAKVVDSDNDGILDAEITLDKDKFAISIVSYLNEVDDGGNYVYRGSITIDDGVNPAYDVITFKNPSYMSTASMALLNMINIEDPVYVRKTVKESELATANPLTNAYDSGKFKGVDKTGVTPFINYDSSNAAYADKVGSSDNFYIVFINPDEIIDSDIIYN